MERQTLPQTPSPVSQAMADIIGAVRQFPNCFYLAVISVKLRYKRSILGPLWITITTAIFIFFISYLYTGFIRADFRHYLLNLALGWIMWQFIADSVLQGAQTFQGGARIIQASSMEKFFLVLQTVLTSLIIFAHNLLIVVVVLIVAGPPFSATTFLVIPGLILIVLSATWSATLFGLLCARYRDLFPIVQAFMRVLFFVTPIIWSPALLPPNNPRRMFVEFNPFAHYLEVWRKPLMGEAPDTMTWLVVIGCTLLGLVLAFVAFARYRRWVVFWV
jgi:ABC-type polysaccharide/polyol phosphate export permease